MRRLFRVSLLLAALALTLPLALQAGTGNGLPSGPHYNLNIIGVEKGKKPSMTNSNRHTIFVALGKSGSVMTPIYLTPGDFTVCDGNGFDEAYDCSGNQVAPTGAVFQLPCDLLTNSDVTYPCDTNQTAYYDIYAAALGQPGGSADITTCATDPSTGTLVCSSDNVVLVRQKGKPSFQKVTNELTTISTTTGSYEIFSSLLEDYFWAYDNNGLRLAQLRFYLVPAP